MSATLIDGILGGVLRWARSKSRVGLGVVGALPGSDAAAWANPRLLPIGMPTDANAPRHADLLVVVGRISHKLAPFLVRTHAAMAQPAQVLVIELENPSAGLPRTYATLEDVTQILPVDVVIRSTQPHQELIERALAALDARAAAPAILPGAGG